MSETRDRRPSLEWCVETELTLDITHAFASVHIVSSPLSIETLHVVYDDVIINTHLVHLLSIYRMWRARDVKLLAAAHNLQVLARDTAATLLEKLLNHACTVTCPHILAIFTTLRAPRTEEQLNRPRAIPRSSCPVSRTSYFPVVDDTLRRFIIADWQRTVNTDNLRLQPCAVCARRAPAHTTLTVDPRDIDLSLLRNDALPIAVRPTTYAFELYHQALLYPKALSDPWSLAPFTICSHCHNDLVKRTRMPKLCLANWLYYALDELPTDVSLALKASTVVDKLLIAKARTSRISFRFIQSQDSSSCLDHDEPHPTSDDGRRTVPQQYVKGNILVMPQNSTHLNKVLPPSPSVIRDTVCAVFVGRTKPTRQTIRKVRTLLARKSTVETLINFLISNNPYYAVSDDFLGLSRPNLDALFSADDAMSDTAIPCAMEIGFLSDNDAVQASTSDYTHRNTDVEIPPDPDTLFMENVGYTCGDESPLAYQEMKMRALAHCLAKRKFLSSTPGDHFVPDFKNPSLLTQLFPHLDPWGIGGFHHPNRKYPITIDEERRDRSLGTTFPAKSCNDFLHPWELC